MAFNSHRGFPCPKCEARTEITYTRTLANNTIARTRLCPACNHTCTTTEALANALPEKKRRSKVSVRRLQKALVGLAPRERNALAHVIVALARAETLRQQVRELPVGLGPEVPVQPNSGNGPSPRVLVPREPE